MMATRVSKVKVVGGLAAASILALTLTQIFGPSLRVFAVGHSTTQLGQHPAEHRIPTIDGASSPTLIPDDTAYLLLLRMSGHPDSGASRAYLKFIFEPTGVSAARAPLDDDTIRRLATVVVEHTLLLRSLEDLRPEPPTRDTLHRGRATIVESFRAQMVRHLGTDGPQRLREVIEHRIKPKIRVFSRP